MAVENIKKDMWPSRRLKWLQNPN